MLQPKRGDGPLIKVAGTSASAGRCRQQRLRCGESEPFKCGWGRGWEAESHRGVAVGGASGRARPAPPHPLECPPESPRLGDFDPTPRLREGLLGPIAGKDALKSCDLPPALQETLQRGKA